MEDLVRLLIKKNVTISSVESFTVGNFAATLGSVPGVSAVYKGSLVSYQTIIKHQVLGIPREVIDTYGGKKVGLIYIGIAYKDEVHTYEYELEGSRKQIVEQALAIGKMKISEILK